MKTESQSPLHLHPIQVKSINILELFIRANQLPDNSIGIEENELSLTIGHTAYDEENHIINVSIKLEIVTDETEQKPPFSMKIELFGIFQVDENRFSREHVTDWAKRNAPFVLIPYLREHAFALTTRAGFRPMLLPLLEVTTFSLDKKPQPVLSHTDDEKTLV